MTTRAELPEDALDRARREVELTLRDLVIFPTVAKERLRDESTPEGRKIWADVEKAAANLPEGALGTYVCRFCGRDEPHNHNKDIAVLMLRELIKKHRDAIARLEAAAREEAIAGVVRELKAFRDGLPWSREATEHEKTLVLGNLNGAIAAVKRGT